MAQGKETTLQLEFYWLLELTTVFGLQPGYHSSQAGYKKQSLNFLLGISIVKGRGQSMNHFFLSVNTCWICYGNKKINKQGLLVCCEVPYLATSYYELWFDFQL